jgi:hypothetical protein
MVLNTTCPCNACKNMHLLDLKAAVHYGEYLIQKFGDKEELLGADVIVPHRMLKNSVIEKTGVKAYAIFSEAAAAKLDLSTLCQPLIPLTETYEHLGEVRIYVHNLRTAWEHYLENTRCVVEPETAWVKIEVDIPFPPALIWDYVTSPGMEVPILGVDSAQREDDLGGRIRPGAIIHCAHSASDFINTIVDWVPFQYFTINQNVFGDVNYLRTIRLEANGATTRFGAYFSSPDKEPPAGYHDLMITVLSQGYGRITLLIQADIDRGKVTAN